MEEFNWICCRFNKQTNIHTNNHTKSRGGGGVLDSKDNEGNESSAGGVVLPGVSTSAKGVRNITKLIHVE